MLERKALIRERCAVYAFTPCAVTACDVATLNECANGWGSEQYYEWKRGGIGISLALTGALKNMTGFKSTGSQARQCTPTGIGCMEQNTLDDIAL